MIAHECRAAGREFQAAYLRHGRDSHRTHDVGHTCAARARLSVARPLRVAHPARAHALFRCVQQALPDAIRHGRAGIDAGIAGSLLTDVSLEEFADAARAVPAGRTLTIPVGARARARVRSQGTGFDAHEHPEALTPREVEILQLVAAGMSNREIADSLAVVEGTGRGDGVSELSF